MKKFLVLIFLLALPVVAYLFFASGVHHFGRLPKLTENVAPLTAFTSIDGRPVQFENKITILSFFGSQVSQMKGHASNLNWVIYNDFYKFKDFQFITLVEKHQEKATQSLKQELSRTTDISNWHFVEGSPEAIQEVFNSLQTDLTLNENKAIPRVFIIGKNRVLRGRNDDEDEGKILYGYDASKAGGLKNKMVDDVKIILAEYRLQLKKYKRRNTTL